jgi:hypothetical protein
VAGLVGWLAFYVLDRWYYHMLLVGAVNKAQEIELAVKERLPFINLAETLVDYSRIQFRRVHPSVRIKARHKLDFFYLTIASLMGAALLVVGRT